MIIDFLFFNLSFLIAILLLGVLPLESTRYIPSQQVNEWIIVHFSLSLICVLWFLVRLRHYTYRKPFWLELKEVIRTLIILATIELAVIAFSKLYFSRYFWGFIWVIVLIIVPIGRILTKKLLINSRLYLKNTVIIGSGKNAVDAYNALTTEEYLGLKVIFFVRSNISMVENLDIPVISKENLWDVVDRNVSFIIALENGESEQRDFWLRELAIHKCRSVSVIPTLRGLPLYSTDMSFLFSYEVMLLRINNNLAKRSSRILKRAMDIIGSLAVITVLSPILLILYFLIKKDGGNAIYGHPRIGRNGKEFNCLKFRSMVVNSKEVLEHLLATDPEARAEWDKDFKLRNDPRITKVGAFIRRTSLDELPQLWNVLKGEMSLVGPRPIVKEELERYEEDIDYYLMAKPGMTGLWQVSGRNDVDYKTRVYFDSWYVKNWSLWNDIAILFKTVNIVLKRDGAY
ncbi:undecaprenyl-phosphate galactose phosphotransferase WbaP [Ursidibacter maritimus]|uniref:undecaprenyl-phosphate galactose phosphotransferase WbaP n=1 Tax=Ursidibacter maritimus TaxID=1331689 RepID=UPI001C491D1D|nr:undecaprenyl-phosphate galactose phosphotransferase WbaP [Ursidibacter maritimus]